MAVIPHHQVKNSDFDPARLRHGRCTVTVPSGRPCWHQTDGTRCHRCASLCAHLWPHQNRGALVQSTLVDHFQVCNCAGKLELSPQWLKKTPACQRSITGRGNLPPLTVSELLPAMNTLFKLVSAKQTAETILCKMPGRKTKDQTQHICFTHLLPAVPPSGWRRFMWLCCLRFRQRIKWVFCVSDLHLRQQDAFPHVGHD